MKQVHNNEIWFLSNNNHTGFAIPSFLAAADKLQVPFRYVDIDLISFNITSSGEIHFYLDGVLIEQLPSVAMFYAVKSAHINLIRKIWEGMGVECINNSSASHVANNKVATYGLVANNGVPLIRTQIVDEEFNLPEGMTFPFILKSTTGSFGDDVFLINNLNDWNKCTMDKNIIRDWIAQEFIDTSHGFDLRVHVVNGKVIGAYERHSLNGDFRANISQGGKSTIVALNDDATIIQYSEIVAKQTGLFIAGLDYLWGGDDRGWVFCEANNVPGFKGFLNPITKELEVNYPEIVLNEIINKYPNIFQKC